MNPPYNWRLVFRGDNYLEQLMKKILSVRKCKLIAIIFISAFGFVTEANAQIGSAPLPSEKLVNGPSLTETLRWVEQKVNQFDAFEMRKAVDELSPTREFRHVELKSCRLKFYELRHVAGNTRYPWISIILRRYEADMAGLSLRNSTEKLSSSTVEALTLAGAETMFSGKTIEFQSMPGRDNGSHMPHFSRDPDAWDRVLNATPVGEYIGAPYTKSYPGGYHKMNVRQVSDWGAVTLIFPEDPDLRDRVKNAFEHAIKLCREENAKEAAKKSFVKPTNEPF